jgi:hypothetical protein
MLSDFTGVIQKGTREEALLGAIAWDRLPRHVAIIMDGNGRWAAQRSQPRIAGHRAGVEAVRAAVDTGARLGLTALTLYAFSTENWKRPRYEVDALMRMLRRYIRIELDEIDRQNIKFQTIGRTGALAENVRKEITRATEQTARNKGMILTVALRSSTPRAPQSDASWTKAAVPTRSPKNASRTSFTRATCPSSICSCERAASCGFQTFYSGKARTVKSTSLKPCGPISGASTCSKLWSTTSAATGASED